MTTARGRLGLGLAVLLLALLLPRPQPVLAHALLQGATPTPEAVLQQSPRLVHLWFSEDLNEPASQIIVWDHYRHVETLGHASIVSGRPHQLTVRLKPLATGSYLVLWTSVSAVDGHVLRGSYSFSVRRRGPLPSLAGVSFGSGQGFPDVATLTSLIVHWVELLMCVVWIGAAAFSAFVLAPFRSRLDGPIAAAEANRLRAALTIALPVLALSSAILLLLQTHSIAGDWRSTFSADTLRSVFSVQYGRLWIVRQALVGVTLLLVIAGAIRWCRRWQPLVAVLGGVYLYMLAGSGHAASADVGPLDGEALLSASTFVDWLHLVAVSLWFGGQMYIVLVLAPALRSRRDLGPHAGFFLAALDRFSPVAYASVLFFTVSGGFNGKIHIDSWYAFFHSVYGWALTVKMGLIGCMMLTSVVTVYGLRPRLRRALAAARHDLSSGSAILMDSLLRWLRVEPVLGLGVLLATSVMFYYPVPVGLAPPPPTAYAVQASGLFANVSVKPGRAGPNAITIRLRDRRDRPVQQARLIILSTMLDMPMGTGLVDLTDKGPGVFGGTADLGMGGHWRILILVYRPSGLTWIPVEVRVTS